MLFGNKSTFDYMVAGLGNPGIQYENTRHNAGFLAADKIADKYGVQFNRQKENAIYTDIKISDKRILLVKPQTYMNNSGSAVSALARFYKIPPEKIIVIFDDISLDVGKLRIRRKGSHGGHNGIKDIIELLGTENIPRIKIGVGQKPHPDYDLKDWVLGRFPKEQLSMLSESLAKAVLSVEEIIKNGIDSAMNKYTG